jgi:hypothetical protein
MTQDDPRKPPDRPGRVPIGLVLSLVLGVAIGALSPHHWNGSEGGAGAPAGAGVEDDQAELDIRRLYDQERDNLVRMDIEGQARRLPDDFVVTNPLGMFIRKPEVVERLKADIVKYSRYERGYDYFRRYGDTMIVAGSETVEPTPDAKRPDAGETIRRRFTEVWVHRDGGWQKVARHASNMPQP